MTVVSEWAALRAYIVAQWSSTAVDWSFWSGSTFVPTSGTSFLRPTVFGPAGRQVST